MSVSSSYNMNMGGVQAANVTVQSENNNLPERSLSIDTTITDKVLVYTNRYRARVIPIVVRNMDMNQTSESQFHMLSPEEVKKYLNNGGGSSFLHSFAEKFPIENIVVNNVIEQSLVNKLPRSFINKFGNKSRCNKFTILNSTNHSIILNNKSELVIDNKVISNIDKFKECEDFDIIAYPLRDCFIVYYRSASYNNYFKFDDAKLDIISKDKGSND